MAAAACKAVEVRMAAATQPVRADDDRTHRASACDTTGLLDSANDEYFAP